MIKMVIAMGLIMIPRIIGGFVTIGIASTMEDCDAAAAGSTEVPSHYMADALPTDAIIVDLSQLKKIVNSAVMPMKITAWGLTILDATHNSNRVS